MIVWWQPVFVVVVCCSLTACGLICRQPVFVVVGNVLDNPVIL